jgi:hypothetical protein
LAEIDHLLRIIAICPKEEMFIRSKDKIWFARNKILKKNADWFLQRDYKANIKKDHKQRMIETLVNIVKTKYDILSPEEKEMFWNEAIRMLQLVTKFRQLTKDYMFA